MTDLNNIKKRLEDAGIKDVESIPVGSLDALGQLSDDDIKGLVKAQQATMNFRAVNGFGGTLF